MTFLIDRIRDWRIGAVSGINATENNLKMTVAVIGPFLVGWVCIKMFLPDQYYDMAVTVSMFIWLAYVVMLWAWCKSDASGYIPFPQSKWKFADGTCRTFDLKVPPDSWEKLAEFPDGKTAYKVYFADKYVYQDPDLPFPDIFDCAIWILPALWDTTFQRRAFGEFFHKGMFVNHPACEDISVYAFDWETKEGERIPICMINDCAFTYQRALANYRQPVIEQESGFNEAEALAVLLAQSEKREGKLLEHNAYLEDRLEVAEKDSARDFKKASDERLKAIRERHARIMSTKPPIMTRLVNVKTIATALLVCTFILVVGRVIFNWW